MRTLKKALSLVLVLAMVFALAVPGFAADTTKKASDFKDYSKVTNKEAVDVMTAIGVINGNADGTFAPEGNFTRAEAATMITYLTLGKTVADALPTGATQFTDVPATHWAAKYVQYCAQEGIVAGVGNGKFDPDAKLTATQWALMLLGALGYKAANEGISGAGWEIATTKLAIQAGVATAEDLTATFNRDMAAKFALNTLTATMVKYEGGSTVTVNGVTFTNGATRKDVTNTKDKGYKETEADNDELMQFCEEHFKTLKITAASHDVFGRPANNWTLNGKAIASASTAKAVVTYTTAQKESAIYNDLGASGIQGSSALYVVMDEIWADGVQVAASEEISGHKGQYQATSGSNASYKESVVIAKADSSNTAGPGQGVVTEIFATKTANHYIMVCTHEYIAKVTGITKANTTTGTDRSVTLSVEGVGTKTFTTEEFAKGDYVIVTMANGAVKTAVAAQKVENVGVTSYTGTSVTAGNTTYKYSQMYTGDKTFNMTAEDTFNFYLDTHGNIIKSETFAAANTNYVFVVAKSTAKQGDATVETEYRNVKYIDATGKVTTCKVAEAQASSLESTKWYTVSEDSKNTGYMKLEAVAADYNKSAELTKVGTNWVLSKTQPTVASGILANASTVFVLKTADNTYKTYTGIANVPGYTKDSAVTAYAVVKNGYAVVVYVDVSNATAATTGADTLVYMVSTGATTKYDATNKVYYKTYTAILNGEKTTIDVANDATGVEVGLLKVTEYDNYGRANKFAAVNGDAYAMVPVSAKAVSYSEPTLKIDDTAYLVSANTAVYTIDANDEFATATAETLVGDSVTGTFYIVYKSTTDKTITAIYFDGTIA